METKNSKMFDRIVKDTFSNHEVPYSPNEWVEFEQKLNNALKLKLYNKIKWASAGFIIVTAILTSLYFINSNKTVEQKNDAKLKVAFEKIDGEQVISIDMPEDDAKVFVEKINETYSKEKPIKKKTSTITENNTIANNENNLNDEKIEDKNKIQEIEKEDKPLMVNQPEVKTEKNLSVAVNKFFVCTNEEVSFFPSVTDKKYQYHWEFGDGRTSSESNPVYTFTAPGQYDVMLNVKNDEENLKASVKITVNPRPEADFEYNIMQEGLAYPKVIFNDNSTEAMYWEWQFGDGKVSFEQNPTHVYFINSDKRINVSLSAMNVHGCKDIREKTIVFDNVFDIMAPNAFSPDGDGLNDYFLPKALEIHDIPFEMFIYDRAGTMVFNTKTKSYPWDGRIAQTGLIPDSGTYIWIVILQDINGNNIKYGGTVSIIK